MRKKVGILLASAILITACGEATAPKVVAVEKDERLETALKQLANKVDRLQEIDQERMPANQEKEKKEIIPDKVSSPIQEVKQEVKPQELKPREKLYSFTGNNISLGSAINYTFGNDYSIVFDSDVDVKTPIIVSIKNLPVEEACLEMTKRAYWCEVDKGKKILRVSGFRELTLALPDGIEEITYETGLGGNVLNSGTGSRTGTTGGMGEMTTGSSSGGSGLTSNSKITIKSNLQRNAFEDYIKSMLSDKGQLAVNWWSKTLYLKDRPDRVGMIERFVKDMNETLNKSVFIEAKIFAVSTDVDLETGIKWDKIIKNIRSKDNQISMNFNSPVNAPVFTLTYAGNTLTSIISVLEQKGDVKELISPKLKTLNLTPASIVRGTNEPYVVYNPISTSTGSGVVNQTNTTVNYAFSGINLFIKPYVVKGRDGEEVYLTIQPSVSSVDNYETFTDSQGNTMKLPKTTITSQITKLKVLDDQTVIMGGLIWDGRKKMQTGIPLLDSIPILGRLFKNDIDMKKKVYLLLAVYTKVEDTNTVKQGNYDISKESER
jgi:hypothetical protein